jgi:hypothetical protein
VKNVTLHNLLGISLEQIAPAKETMRRLLDGAARHIADDTRMAPAVSLESNRKLRVCGARRLNIDAIMRG